MAKKKNRRKFHGKQTGAAASSFQLLTLYLVLMAGVFPLFVTHYYYNIQWSKSIFFISVTCAFFAAALLLLFVRGRKSTVRNKSFRELPLSGRTALIFLLVFAAWSLLSALLSEDAGAALLGSGGRWIGALFLLACSLSVCLITFEGGRGSDLPLFIFAGVFSFVMLLGILHLCNIDVFGFLAHVPEEKKGLYCSTIGNTDFFCQFATIGAVLFPVMAYERKKPVFLIPAAFGIGGLLLGKSDSCLIAYLAALLILPLLLPREEKISEGKGKKIFFRIYPFILGLLVCLFILLLILANTGVISVSALVFSDSFGTNRGYIFRKLAEYFSDSSLRDKLLGCGPDCLTSVTDTFRSEMLAKTGQVFDSAHNDFLQYLITTGIPGAFAYAGFVISTLISGFRKKRSGRTACTAVFICLVLEGLFIPSQPITTPFLFLFAGLIIRFSLCGHKSDINYR